MNYPLLTGIWYILILNIRRMLLLKIRNITGVFSGLSSAWLIRHALRWEENTSNKKEHQWKTKGWNPTIEVHGSDDVPFLIGKFLGFALFSGVKCAFPWPPLLLIHGDSGRDSLGRSVFQGLCLHQCTSQCRSAIQTSFRCRVLAVKSVSVIAFHVHWNQTHKTIQCSHGRNIYAIYASYTFGTPCVAVISSWPWFQAGLSWYFFMPGLLFTSIPVGHLSFSIGQWWSRDGKMSRHHGWDNLPCGGRDEPTWFWQHRSALEMFHGLFGEGYIKLYCIVLLPKWRPSKPSFLEGFEDDQFMKHSTPHFGWVLQVNLGCHDTLPKLNMEPCNATLE